MACNATDTVISRTANTPAPQTQQPQSTPSDGARRITAQEVHDLWEKNKVLIIDTRDEASYKTNHIKGAIWIPVNQILAKADELPRDKMIVTYCT